MVAQSELGLLLRDHYRDASWIRGLLLLVGVFAYAFADWPGELAIWGPLAASATAVTVWLFSNASQPGEV